MSTESEELSIRGSLSESSLPELLASISRSRETGILNFHDAGRWKAIYFKEGRIIYARWSTVCSNGFEVSTSS
jgi:hypothetical protein